VVVVERPAERQQCREHQQPDQRERALARRIVCKPAVARRIVRLAIDGIGHGISLRDDDAAEHFMPQVAIASSSRRRAGLSEWR
jgi:hypothetical protein